MKKVLVALVAVLGLVAMVSSAQAAVIQPVNATAQSVESMGPPPGGQWGPYNPIRTITGLELTPSGAGVTLASTCGTGSWDQDSPPGSYSIAAEWLTGPVNFSTSPQWIAWDLGASYTIGSFHLWNGNTQSRYVTSADMYLISSLPANGAALPSGTLVGSYTVAGGPPTVGYTGSDYNLTSPTSGQYFLMNITGASGTYAAINEIRFVSADAPVVPEPATLALVAMGALGMLIRRRS